jgi:murein DD-endopeptidase MepM/ murein hydrolase activator NlpD
MLKGERITLLVIPEGGGKTFEVKVPRLALLAVGAAGVFLLLLLALGAKSFVDAHELSAEVATLQRQNALLEEEVGQIQQLEQVLTRLEKSNRQLRAILGEPVPQELPSDQGEPQADDSAVSGPERLRQGDLRRYPGLWPVEGEVVRPFSQALSGAVVAVPTGTPVRASAAGQVVRAGYDPRLGHVVVVDHGRGLMTEYGYNGRLLVEPGASVDRGQPVALSGSSGGAAGPSLFYAVRENGRPRDPAGYRLWL